MGIKSDWEELSNIIQKQKQKNIRLKNEKCKFMLPKKLKKIVQIISFRQISLKLKCQEKISIAIQSYPDMGN